MVGVSHHQRTDSHGPETVSVAGKISPCITAALSAGTTCSLRVAISPTAAAASTHKTASRSTVPAISTTLNAGLISAGGSLEPERHRDISNISSVISGKTVQLESVSGSISNITRRQQWNAGGDSRYGGVHLSGTDTGPVATIKGTDSLSLDAGKNIDITGATVSSGGTLGMSAGNDINIAANLISGAKVSPVSGTLMTTVHHPPPHRAAASAPAVTWRWLQAII